MLPRYTYAGVIPLQTVTQVNSLSDKKHGCRFDVVVGDPSSSESRTFSFLADTDAECDRWVSKLKMLVSRFRSEEAKNLDIEVSGKFWKKTVEIREARARSSHTWGDERYLTVEEEAEAEEAKSPSTSASASLSLSEDPDGADSERKDRTSVHCAVPPPPLPNGRQSQSGVAVASARAGQSVCDDGPPVEITRVLTEGRSGQVRDTVHAVR